MPQLYMILKIIFKIIFVFAVFSYLISVGRGAHCAASAGMGELADGCGRCAVRVIAFPDLPLWCMVRGRGSLVRGFCQALWGAPSLCVPPRGPGLAWGWRICRQIEGCVVDGKACYGKAQKVSSAQRSLFPRGETW